MKVTNLSIFKDTGLREESEEAENKMDLMDYQDELHIIKYDATEICGNDKLPAPITSAEFLSTHSAD